MGKDFLKKTRKVGKLCLFLSSPGGGVITRSKRKVQKPQCLGPICGHIESSGTGSQHLGLQAQVRGELPLCHEPHSFTREALLVPVHRQGYCNADSALNHGCQDGGARGAPRPTLQPGLVDCRGKGCSCLLPRACRSICSVSSLEKLHTGDKTHISLKALLLL